MPRDRAADRRAQRLLTAPTLRRLRANRATLARCLAHTLRFHHSSRGRHHRDRISHTRLCASFDAQEDWTWIALLV
jgi:hypothetical protein